MRGTKEKFSEADIRRAIALHDRGHSWRYAALAIGISESRLMVRVARLSGKPYPSSVQAKRPDAMTKPAMDRIDAAFTRARKRRIATDYKDPGWPEYERQECAVELEAAVSEERLRCLKLVLAGHGRGADFLEIIEDAIRNG